MAASKRHCSLTQFVMGCLTRQNTKPTIAAPRHDQRRRPDRLLGQPARPREPRSTPGTENGRTQPTVLPPHIRANPPSPKKSILNGTKRSILNGTGRTVRDPLPHRSTMAPTTPKRPAPSPASPTSSSRSALPATGATLLSALPVVSAPGGWWRACLRWRLPALGGTHPGGNRVTRWIPVRPGVHGRRAHLGGRGAVS